MVTLVTSAKLVPVMVTPVPPTSEPVAGLTPVTVIVRGVTESLQPGVATAANRPPTIPTALVNVMVEPLRTSKSASNERYADPRLAWYDAAGRRAVAELREVVAAPAVRDPCRCE